MFISRHHLCDQRNFDAVVEQPVDRMTTLIERDTLRENFGRESLSMVTVGRFSVKTRNENLAKTYERSITGR